MGMLRPRPSPTMVSMVPMASHMPTAMESQLSTTANARLRPSPTMVSMELMEAMVSQLSPPTDTHLSTTMASVMLMLMPSPTMVSMELMAAMVSQPSPPTDTHLSTTMASAMLMPSPTMVSTPSHTLDTVATLTHTCTNFAM